nr:hypothetical protein [Tanacetum cinerariifolium]
MGKEMALLKDSDGDDVDVHLYRLISWHCKKQTMVATSTPEAEYVAAASCCGQWVISKPLSVIYILSIALDHLSHSHIRPKPRIFIELANLEFCDKYNMVAFLKKPQGSENFHQIVDFLKASHIRYALTENQTIYVSLINQFWRTASVRTLNNGEIKLNATVDGQVKTIIEVSVRRHLKLADANGISTLPITKIFKHLALMGESRGFSGVETTLLPTMLVTQYILQGEGQQAQLGPNTYPLSLIHLHTSKIYPSHIGKPRREMHDGLGRDATTASSLAVEQGSDKVTHLENELTTTKAVYNKALITLTQQVKKLEKKLNHKRIKAVISLEEEEASLDHKDSPKQERMIEEIDKDENVNLVQSNDDETLAKTLLNIKRSAAKDKGKAIIQESEFVPMESKGQAGEGSSKEVKSLKRSAEEELNNVIPLAIKSPIVSWKSYCKGDVGYYEIHKADGSYKTYIFFSEMLNDFDKEDLMVLYRLFNEKYASTRPRFDDLILWGDMKIMFEPDDDDDELLPHVIPKSSIIHLHHGKTPYELLYNKPPDLSFLHVFGALCYPTNNSENLGKLQPKADIDFDELAAMASAHSSLEPVLHKMTHITISSGLVPNLPLSTPYVPPSRTNWDILFQPLFDELLTPPPSVDLPVPEVIAPIAEVVTPEPVVSIGSPSLITRDVAHMNNDPFFCILIPKNDSESSSSNVIPTIVHTASPNSEHVTKWTKDHPLDDIISELKRPNYKDALTQACWIEAMQEELNEFKRLEVWELIPRPDKVLVNTLKWIYKVKLDGLGGILKKQGLIGCSWNSLKEPWIPHCSSEDKERYSPGLQISQSPRGIFLNQSKYALESLKKYGMESSNPVDTPMVEKSKLDEDPQGKAVDPTHYRRMVSTLMYLTASRPDLPFVVCMCIRYQLMQTLITRFAKILDEVHLESLDKLIGSQITNNSKKGLGYHAVPPPHPLIYNGPTKFDLSYSGINEFKEPEFKGYGPRDKQVSEDRSSFVESPLNVDKETAYSVDKKIEFVKPKMDDKLVRKSVRPRVVTTARPRVVNIAKPRVVNTARPYIAPVNTVRAKRFNVVKASACWVWRPTRPNGASLVFKRHNYIDARGRPNGCSRHMTGNIAYLSDFKKFDRGYVTFEGGSHGGRIFSKDFCNKHNMVAFLEKSEGTEGFHQILDFLNSTHIKYTLTANPIIYVSLIHQFWETASTSILKDGKMKITATIDGRIMTITEASIRRHLKLEDSDGISSLPNTKIFEQLTLMGGQIDQGVESTVPVESHHTPTNAPSTSQPPTSTPSIQTTHDAEEPATMPHDSPLPRVQSLGSVEGSLTLNELTVLCTKLSKRVEELQSDLQQTKLTYGAAYTKLILRVKKLEHKVKTSQNRRKARVVLSDDEEYLEDPFKQGRKIAKIDENPFISLVQHEGTSWIQEDYEIQGRTSADTKILLDQEEPTKLVEDLGNSENSEKEISTIIPQVSTAAENLVYIRRSAEKRKDKGKAIMKEDKSVQKKSEKQLEQERLRHEKAIRLQEKIFKEERQRIARDAKIAKQL